MKSPEFAGLFLFLTFGLFLEPVFSATRQGNPPAFFQGVLEQTLRDEKNHTGATDEDPFASLRSEINDLVTAWEERSPFSGLSDRISGEQVKKTFSEPLSVEDIVVLVLQRNPRLIAGNNRVLAASTELGQATALEIALSQFSGFFTGSKASLPLPALFPFPGMVALKGRMAQEGIMIAREAYLELRRNLAFETRTLLARLIHIHDSLVILQADQRILNRFEKVVQSLYQNGKASFSDLLSVRVRRENLTVRRQNLETSRVSLEAQLQAMLDVAALPGGWKNRLSRELPPDGPPVPARVENALRVRQEIRILEAKIRRVSAAIAMAAKKSRPDWNLTPSLPMNPGAGQYRPVMSAGDPFSRSPAAVRTDPFFGFSQAYIAQMEFLLLALRQELTGVVLQVRSEFESALSAHKTAGKNRRSFSQEILPQMEKILETITLEYQNGSKAFIDLAAAESKWLAAKQGVADSIRDQRIASAALLKASGQVTWEDVTP
jgi:outer membrane protein TolC